MADNFPNLAIVAPLLVVVARVAGCSVDNVSISIHTGSWMQIDVLDEDFDGPVDRAALALALCDALEAATGIGAFDGGPGVSEGSTLGFSVEPIGGGYLQLKLALGVGL